MVQRKKEQQRTKDLDADIVSEDQDDAGDIDLIEEERSGREKIKALREELKQCQKERQEFLDGWQRAQADHLNSKRRSENERTQEHDRQAARFIEALLPVCDSFDMALREFDQNNSSGSEWKAGIERIHAQLMAVLKRYNVTIISPVGAVFDPRHHEALSEMPVSSAAEHHTVLQVLQSGYMINDTLVRPAKVVVGNFSEIA